MNMGLQEKNRFWGTHFEEIEYLAGKFFAIDPYCLVFVFYPSPKVPTEKFIFYRPMKLFKKSVAPAGYKNKQRRKQTSVLSGRNVTAYVPLRSATERERAAFLIPCQGLRGFNSIS